MVLRSVAYLVFVNPVPEEKAMDAAVEQYGFCPDVIDQGPEDATVGAMADVLRQSTVRYRRTALTDRATENQNRTVGKRES